MKRLEHLGIVWPLGRSGARIHGHLGRGAYKREAVSSEGSHLLSSRRFKVELSTHLQTAPSPVIFRRVLAHHVAFLVTT